MNVDIRDMMKPVAALLAVSLTAAALLGVINYITKPAIAANAEAAKAAALEQVLELPPDGAFGEVIFVDPPTDEGVISFAEARASGEIVGYALTVVKRAYAGEMTFMVGINSGGEIAGISIFKHDETPGLGSNAAGSWNEQFIGQTGPFSLARFTPRDNEIVPIAAATITSEAVVDGVNAALEFYHDKLGGGE